MLKTPRRVTIVTSIAALAFAFLAATCLISPPKAHSQAITCPVTGAGRYSRCILMPATSAPRVGQQITDGAANPGTPWMITDKNGAPMAWDNIDGLYSGGDGGAMPGGLICVTDGVLKTVACLTPTGTLELTTPGGATETLTAQDIAYLHSLEGTK